MPPDGTKGTPTNPPGKPVGAREIIFEFTPLGGSVKATAIDVQTGVEVSVTGPAVPSVQRELQRIALAKLKQRLVREGYAQETPEVPIKGNSGGGIIV